MRSHSAAAAVGAPPRLSHARRATHRPRFVPRATDDSEAVAFAGDAAGGDEQANRIGADFRRLNRLRDANGAHVACAVDAPPRMRAVKLTR